MNPQKLTSESTVMERVSTVEHPVLRLIAHVPGKLPSEFNPANRASREEVVSQARDFPNIPILNSFISSIFDIVLVLNKEMQIILANENLRRFVGVADRNSFLGLRPGEVLRCLRAGEKIEGCGASEYCQECGALKAILASQKGEVSVQESRIMREELEDPLDLKVYASPLRENGDQYTILAITDVSHEKRRRALERIFFHDVLNTAGGLHGFVELLQHSDALEAMELKTPLLNLSRELVEEIRAQRDLTAAENNELSVTFTYTKSLAFMHEICGLYKNHEVAEFRSIRIDPASADSDFLTDHFLLRRVVGNMVKNGLEASLENETVTLASRLTETGVEFSVHNPRFMPRSVQLQIFQRSFSTKGSNRGLGTYSMKLLGEQYLGGKVFFTTTPENGTTFKIWLPLAIEDKNTPSGEISTA
jgi:signal transduction histidine kinase